MKDILFKAGGEQVDDENLNKDGELLKLVPCRDGVKDIGEDGGYELCMGGGMVKLNGCYLIMPFVV